MDGRSTAVVVTLCHFKGDVAVLSEVVVLVKCGSALART